MRNHPMTLVYLLFMIGLWPAWAGITGLFRVVQVKSWPTTQGLLRGKEPWVTGRGNTWIPIMKYEYQVGGHVYTGEKISYDKITTESKQDLEEMTAAYVPGMPVTVHYQPGNPATAVLQVGSFSQNALLAGLGLSALCAAALITWLYRRKFGSLQYNPFAERG